MGEFGHYWTIAEGDPSALSPNEQGGYRPCLASALLYDDERPRWAACGRTGQRADLFLRYSPLLDRSSQLGMQRIPDSSRAVVLVFATFRQCPATLISSSSGTMGRSDVCSRAAVRRLRSAWISTTARSLFLIAYLPTTTTQSSAPSERCAEPPIRRELEPTVLRCRLTCRPMDQSAASSCGHVSQ